MGHIFTIDGERGGGETKYANSVVLCEEGKKEYKGGVNE